MKLKKRKNPTQKEITKHSKLSEVDLTEMFSQYANKLGKAKYAAKTPLDKFIHTALKYVPKKNNKDPTAIKLKKRLQKLRINQE